MITRVEREELKALSKAVLGGENKWQRFVKGVKVQLRTPDGTPMWVEGTQGKKKQVPMLTTFRKSEADLLIELRALKQKADDAKAQQQSVALKDLEGVVGGIEVPNTKFDDGQQLSAIDSSGTTEEATIINAGQAVS